MNNKEIDAAQLKILSAIEKISTPLTLISLLKLANEFYSLEERKLLYEKYRVLCECADQERIKSPLNKVDFEVLKQANKNIADFQKEHPIITNIVNKKNALT